MKHKKKIESWWNVQVLYQRTYGSLLRQMKEVWTIYQKKFQCLQAMSKTSGRLNYAQQGVKKTLQITY